MDSLAHSLIHSFTNALARTRLATQVELRRRRAIDELSIAADTALAMPHRESLTALTEVVRAADELRTGA